MEGEAYLLGNGFIVRFFEEYIKESEMIEEVKSTTNEVISEQVENEPVAKEEVVPEVRPETVEEYRLRRKKIIADELMRRWIKKD